MFIPGLLPGSTSYRRINTTDENWDRERSDLLADLVAGYCDSVKARIASGDPEALRMLDMIIRQTDTDGPDIEASFDDPEHQRGLLLGTPEAILNEAAWISARRLIAILPPSPLE